MQQHGSKYFALRTPITLPLPECFLRCQSVRGFNYEVEGVGACSAMANIFEITLLSIVTKRSGT